MKKYILVIMLSIVSLVSFNLANAQTDVQKTACSGKKNGDACSYTTPVQNQRGGGQTGGDQTGKCDRNGDGVLYCSTTLTDWEDCFDKSEPNDKCKDKGKEGVCESSTSGTSVRNQRTTWTCNTSGTPGGGTGTPSTGGTTPGGGTGTPSTGGTTPGGGTGTPASDGTTPDAAAPQTVGFINPIRFNSLTELIAGIINALLGILGAITVAVLVKSGFEYMISSAPGAVGKALDGIKNAIVGLMIIMGAFLITQYVISALA